MTTHTVPTGTMATALVSSGLVGSTFKNYDLVERIVEDLSDGALKARTLSSIAWIMDSTCINFARTVFNDTYKKAVGLSMMETNSITEFNQIITGMSELDHELWGIIDECSLEGEHSFSIGYEDTTAIGQLKQCLTLRPEWHQAAMNAAEAIGRGYEPKTFIELLAAEKVSNVAPQSVEELRLNAQFEANGDSKLAEVYLAQKIERRKAMAEAQFKYRRQTNTAIAKILYVADQKRLINVPNSFTHHSIVSDTATTEVAFYTLPLVLQNRFTLFALNCILRTLDELAADTRTLVQDMAIERAQGHRMVQELRAALKHFNQQLDN